MSDHEKLAEEIQNILSEWYLEYIPRRNVVEMIIAKVCKSKNKEIKFLKERLRDAIKVLQVDEDIIENSCHPTRQQIDNANSYIKELSELVKE